MKKSRIVLVTLLTSLGLAVAIGVQNSHFIGNQLNTGIVAKADVVNSSITSRRGGTTPISTPWESAPILKFGTKIIRFCVIMIKIRIGVFL